MKQFCIWGVFVFLFISCFSKQQNENQSAISNRSNAIDKEKVIVDTLKKDSVIHEMSQGEIDSPISLSEIEKIEERISLRRLVHVPVTHVDAYKIRTQQPVYSPDVKVIRLDVINVDAPTAEPEYHNLEQWSHGKWKEFPFIDNLAFAGVGRDLSKGGVAVEDINSFEFKNPFSPTKYKVHFYVYANLYTYCMLTENAILPIEESILKGAFDFKVLKSEKDSIRILFANHTNLRVQPAFLPSVGTDELYSVHPLARSGWSSEHKWMEKNASLAAGEGIIFSIPVSWDVSRLQKTTDASRFLSGRLSPGKYKLGIGIEVYMNTEFTVK